MYSGILQRFCKLVKTQIAETYQNYKSEVNRYLRFIILVISYDFIQQKIRELEQTLQQLTNELKVARTHQKALAYFLATDFRD